MTGYYYYIFRLGKVIVFLRAMVIQVLLLPVPHGQLGKN